MSNDERVTKDLIQTLEDGREGFAKGAEKLSGTDRPDLATPFREFSEQRARLSDELRGLSTSYGEGIEQDGTVAATLHRGWMSLKDALSGSDPHGVLDAAEQGEDHAVKQFEEALQSEISPELRAVVERQYRQVKAAHDQVRSLRNALV